MTIFIFRRFIDGKCSRVAGLVGVSCQRPAPLGNKAKHIRFVSPRLEDVGENKQLQIGMII